MTKILTRKYLSSIAAISLALGAIYALPSRALALTVSPVKVELSGNPGQSLQGEILLFNEEKGEGKAETFYSSFANFEANGESGAPRFTSIAQGLAAWIKAPSQITLNQGEKKNLSYIIEIPKTALPGGYSAAIFWSAAPSEQINEGALISANARLGILMLLTVNGEAKKGEADGILEFNAGDSQKIFASLPIDLAYRFQNSSGSFIKPDGEIKIKNVFGGVLAVLNANHNQGTILPASIRKFTVTWASTRNIKKAMAKPQLVVMNNKKSGFFNMIKKEWKNFAFGLYSAELYLEYDGNKKDSASYNFFVIPWQLLSVIFAVPALLCFLGITGFKRYKRWIIARS